MKQYRMRVLFTCTVMLGTLAMFAAAAVARHQPKYREAKPQMIDAANKVLELGYQCKINGASLEECRALLMQKLAERGVR